MNVYVSMHVSGFTLEEPEVIEFHIIKTTFVLERVDDYYTLLRWRRTTYMTDLISGCVVMIWLSSVCIGGKSNLVKSKK